MRHPLPDYLIEYNKGRPECCHTCEHYNVHGRCAVFDMEPPQSFADERGACPEYFPEVPF